MLGEDVRLDVGIAQGAGLVGDGQARERPVRRPAHERVVAGEAAEDADRAGRDLRVEVRARGVLLHREVEDGAPRLRIVDVLHGGEGDRLPTAAGDLGQHPQLVILAEALAAELGEVPERLRRDRLEHAAAAVGHAVHQLRQLDVGGVGAGYRLATDRPVEDRARRREADRARGDRLGEQTAHRREVVGGRVLVLDAALAHHLEAQ